MKTGGVGYYSPGASFGAKVGLNAVGAELIYAATAKKPTLKGAVASGLSGAVSGVMDWGMDALVAPSLDTFGRIYPSPVARAIGSTLDGSLKSFRGKII